MERMQPVALKEWAVAIRALAEGTQIVLMRKGGIAEETRDFHLKSPSFWLYPTYEHQKRELLKEEAGAGLDETLAGWSPQQTYADIECFATVEADIEVTSQEQLDRIRSTHIWTDRFAEERLKWKRQKPLHVLVLRVHRLDLPVRIPILDAYSGCTSWIRLEGDFTPGAMKPVMDDEAFKAKAEQIKTFLSV